MNKIVNFQGYYRFLSNFWPVEVEYNGLLFESVEHAYQAAKCVTDEDRLDFNGISAGEAKRLGRKKQIRKDWDKVKLSVMENLVRQKFSKDKILKQKLLNTGTVLLEEGNTWRDTFWGVYRGQGENNLGKILMKIREELR